MHELDRDILEILAQSGAPVGATGLHLMLKDKHKVSQAWIGKKLSEFDHKNLTQKCGFKGRMLTDLGRTELERLSHRADQVRESNAFLKTLTLESGERLIDVLVARRALEREIAFLAAERRTDKEVKRLEEALRRQDLVVMAGGSAATEDIEFHDLIAKASRNEVLFHALRVVRHASRYTSVVARIRQEIKGSLGKEHRAIWESIRDQDPQGASRAMDMHLSGLINDVKKYLAEHSAISLLNEVSP